MKCCEIIETLEELAPPEMAEEWDNCGLLVGRRDKEVRKIFLAVDATDENIDDAIALNTDLIITHHPLIFKPVKQINSDDFITRRILKLASHDISYYAMHTNFDIMGLADAAADELNLNKREVLQVTFEDDIAKEGFGRVGRLPEEMSLLALAEYVKKVFGLDAVKVFGDKNSIVKIAAILPGAGKSMIDDAIDAGADVLITGDIDHHSGIDAMAKSLSIIDAGHYGIEKLFTRYIKDYIKRNIIGIDVYTAKDKNPFYIV